MNKRKFIKFFSSAALVFLMVITIIGSVSAFVVVIPKIFEDVTIFHWAAEYIGWLKDNGISVGYPDGTFRPDNYITRAEMAVMLKKTASTVAAAGAHIKVNNMDEPYIADWFNNVNTTAPTMEVIWWQYQIDFGFDTEDKFVMCAVDGQDSIYSSCSVYIASDSGKVIVSIYDAKNDDALTPTGFWVQVYGKDIQP
jgi:hypothetical protein